MFGANKLLCSSLLFVRSVVRLFFIFVKAIGETICSCSIREGRKSIIFLKRIFKVFASQRGCGRGRFVARLPRAVNLAKKRFISKVLS